MLKLSVLDENNRRLTIQLLDHQGVLNATLKNFKGAIHSFQKMRDVAEDANC